MLCGLFCCAELNWLQLLGTTPLEIIATLCSVASTFLVARQKVWGWPLGLVWAAISTYLAFFEWQLVSDAILYASYIPIQLYCWRLWVQRDRKASETPFLPTWLPRHRTQMGLALAALGCIALWAGGVSWLSQHVAWVPTPALLWRDSTTTVLNYFAQFLQAKKRMENWVFWLVVNILGIHVYLVKGSPVYAVQYGFFLLLGLYGWQQWAASRRRVPRPLRVVLTGPESTAKSALTQALARHFQAPCADEYARSFLEAHGPAYDEPLLRRMWRRHLAHQTRCISQGAPLAFLDTDLINYKIWFEVVFGRVPAALCRAQKAEAHHVYLLCAPDIPWTPDPLRENPDDRERLFQKHLAEIERAGRSFRVVEGTGEARVTCAIEAVRSLQAERAAADAKRGAVPSPRSL